MGYEAPRWGRFERRVVWRLAVGFACIAAAAWLFGRGRYWVIASVLVAIAIGQAFVLAAQIRGSHARIAQALARWRSRELADRDAFARRDARWGESAGSAGRKGTGRSPPEDLADTAFPELAQALDGVTRQLAADRARIEEELRALQAIVGHAPVALLVMDRGASAITLLNHAARRMFGAVGSLDELAAFGDSFVRDLADTPAGERRVSRSVHGGIARRVLITAGVFRAPGGERRLIAIESIESELEARTLEAWVDMARVLAHEIMSSLTPVASLTASAAQLLGELATDQPTSELVAEAQLATETAARRSERLMTFVRRYREIAQLPAAQLAPLDAVELVRGVAALLGGELAAAGIALAIDAPPSALAMRGDRGLLEQALINLVRNAADAVRGRPAAQIWLTVRLTVDDHLAIEIADNGPGVAPGLVDQIFVPFFTTKPSGSGIGLSVAQHVAHAHHGALRLAGRPGGGAVFTLAL